MARNTKKVALVSGRVIRVTRLDACGRPVYGDNNVVTSEGFISVGLTANTNDTDETRVTAASGKTIVFEPSVTELSGYGVEIVLGEVDPDLFALITGQSVVLDADGNSAGFDVDTQISLSGSGFALEVWAGAPAGGACDDVQAQGTYGYILLPFLQGGILGDFSIENGGISFTLTGANTKDGNSWGKGPFNVQLNGAAGSRTPGKLLTPVSPTAALRVLLVDVAPPEVEVGTRPLLNPANTPLTAVTGTVNGRVVALAVTPNTGHATAGVWYEFGDGTWDYVTSASGATSHTYTAAGTYTVMASTNGVWVTTNVVVA